MRILVDADACPVKDIIIDLAKEYEAEVIMFLDNSHEYENDYAKVIICDKHKDSADLLIANEAKNNDIVVTQDYGLSSLVLSKCKVLHINGFVIDNSNIDELLFKRHINAKLRNKQHIKGLKKRTKELDEAFYWTLKKELEGDLHE